MTADFPAADPVDDGDLTWEKAFAQNAFDPVFLADFPGLHETMLRDHLTALADERFGVGNWLRREPPTIEEFEPVTRERSYEDTDDDGNPILDEAGNPVIVHYHDDMRYFRMTARYRRKLEGER